MTSLNLSPEPQQESSSADLNYEFAAQTRSGASWFYWIAGLSVINSVIFFFGGNWNFFAGLGITQIVDVIIYQISPDEGFSLIKIIGFVFNLIIAGIFLTCGVLANKFYSWAFIAGMIFYLLDGVLLLVIGAYLPAGFHLFALFMIFRGFSAARQITSHSDV